jgi:outer membrane protein assembly factor BamB
VPAIDNCVAIGAPILDSIQIVVDENSEMILQGAGQLANGYLTSGDHDKSPFSSFKTGDIGFCTNGVWYVKGRRDDVVKVNGIWTSPIEIESAFCKAYNVHRTVVAVFVESRDTKVKTSYLLCPDERVCQAFSRTNMHEQHGFPWNIIPSNVFFCHKLPTSSGGAAKISREACRKIVYNHLDQEKNSMEPKQQSNLAKEADHPTFLSLASRALGIKEAALDASKSFVELGGDSATSITLLYLMRTLDGINSNDYTSTDLLNAESLQTFQARLSGEVPSSKRQKPSSPPREKNFKPQSVVRHSKQHHSISLKACVDSTPLVVDDKYIYVACQGGIIVKCDREGSIIDYTQLHGWLVQADLLYLKDQSIIIACAYSLEGKGIVVALSTDLKTDVWKQVMDGAIKASPVLTRNDLWVQAGDTVCVLNFLTGANERAIQVKLPHHSIAKPLIFQKDKRQYIAYASSEWESCLMIVDGNGNIQKELEYEIGPVHRDLCKLDNEMAYIADSYGALHLIDLAAKAIKVTYRLSSNPLSPPLLIGSQTCVVGGYDGILRCVNETGIIWECHVGAAVYSKPVMLRSSVRTIIVSTTAGDLVAIDAAGGKIQWRDHIPAEIWSDLEVGFNDVIVFGARDSRLHLYSKQHLDTTVW